MEQCLLAFIYTRLCCRACCRRLCVTQNIQLINFYSRFVMQLCTLVLIQMRRTMYRLQIAVWHLGVAVKKQHEVSTAASALSGLLTLNLPLSSAALKSPLKQLLKTHWFQDVHADKTFCAQRIKVGGKKKGPTLNQLSEGSWQWFLLDYCLRTIICKHLISGGLFWEKATGGRLLNEVSSVMTSCLSWWVSCWDRVMMTDEAIQSS